MNKFQGEHIILQGLRVSDLSGYQQKVLLLNWLYDEGLSGPITKEILSMIPNKALIYELTRRLG